MPTAQWTSISRRNHPARTRKPTGCRLRRENLSRCCACIGRRIHLPPCSMAVRNRRPSRSPSNGGANPATPKMKPKPTLLRGCAGTKSAFRQIGERQMKALAVCVNAVPKSLRSVVMRAQQAAFLICLGIAASGVSRAADDPKAVEVDGIAVEAYVYAYPLVTVELTRRRLTNVVASDGTKAPMGQFARLRKYPDASYRDVTAPNADTLYTYAYLDVSKEPWVVSIPDLKGRFAVFSLFDGWTTVFADPGKRTTGTGAQTFAITGPGWSGTLPPGVKEYKSATEIALFDGKIYCTGT